MIMDLNTTLFNISVLSHVVTTQKSLINLNLTNAFLSYMDHTWAWGGAGPPRPEI